MKLALDDKVPIVATAVSLNQGDWKCFVSIIATKMEAVSIALLLTSYADACYHKSR